MHPTPYFTRVNEPLCMRHILRSWSIDFGLESYRTPYEFSNNLPVIFSENAESQKRDDEAMDTDDGDGRNDKSSIQSSVESIKV